MPAARLTLPRAVSVLSALLLSLGACTPDVDVPPGAQLACAADGDCPTGFACRQAIARCVKLEGADAVAPGLASSAVEPAAAGPSVDVTATFTTDDDLLRDPDVALVVGSERRGFVKVAQEGRRYTYRYRPQTADGSPLENVARQVVATLVDASGNVATDVALGSVTLDMTGPELTELVADRARVRAGVAVRVTLRVGEPAASVRVLRAGGGALTSLGAAEGVHRFELVPTGSEPEGPMTLTVEATDVAGNLRVTPRAGVFTLDFTPPQYGADAQLGAATVRAGSTARVRFTVSEVLGADPVVELVHRTSGTRLPMTRDASEGNYAFVRQVAADEAEGEYDVALGAFADGAGNAGTPATLGVLRVDRTPPAVTQLALDGADARFRSDETVRVRFAVSEALARPPEVLLGSVPALPMPCVPDGALRYACEVSLQGKGVQEGAADVTVRAEDPAGNPSLAAITATLDFTGPGLASAEAPRYTPAASNRLATPTAATVGTEVSLWLQANELVDTAATLSLVGRHVSNAAAPALGFTLVPGLATRSALTFHSTGVTTGHPDGDYALTLTWTDVAGNPRTLTAGLPVVRVKTSTPVLVVNQAQVLFVRSPQGNASAEALGGFSVPAGALFELAPGDGLSAATSLPASTFSLAGGAAPARVRVKASSAADPDDLLLMGTLVPQGDGTWPRLKLRGLETSVALVTGLDVAGNESAPVLVQNAEWVASTNAPPLGTSPHLLEWTPAVVGSLAQPWASPVMGGGAFGADTAVQLATAAPSWRARTPSPGPQRYDAGLAYDSVRGRAVLFGGSVLGGSINYLQDTWEWDGSAWSERAPVGALPPGRNGHAMVYDSVRGRVVLFGGSSGGGNLADTWEYDGTAWTLRATTGPSARRDHAMAFDAARGRVVLFGGAVGFTALQDTWEWDGSAWTQVAQGAVTRPPVRGEHAMAYDAEDGLVLVFGGFDDATGYRQDTWGWNGSVWTNLTPVSGNPPTRYRHAMAFDPLRDRVVLFGGYHGAGSRAQDTWEWNGTAWVNVTPAGGNPDVREQHRLVFDVTRGRVMLTGGLRSSGISTDDNDVWEWTGSAWQERTPAQTAPPARTAHAMAYDAARGVVTLVGGSSASANLGDVWTWNGSGWTDRTPVTRPSARGNAGLAYDGGRGVTVLFGGFSSTGGGTQGDTWEWNGSAWTQRAPAASPPPRYFSPLAYDAARAYTLVFGGRVGGTYGNDTWTWNGTTWTQRAPATVPPAREGHMLAFDASRSRVVLFGGAGASGQLSDTWEWDGTNWLNRTPASGNPPGRSLGAMAYDSARGRVVLFGGSTGLNSSIQDVWEWNGTAWTQRTPTTARPSERSGAAMAYDAIRGRTVLFGGSTATGVRADTWEWDSAPSRQPAFQLTVAAEGSGLSPARITGMRVRAHAGAAFSPYGAGNVGAALYGWSVGGGASAEGWSPLATNATGATDPLPAPASTRFEWTAASAAEARRYFLERDARLAFQLRPIGSSGSGPQDARVALDYLEVRVRYTAQ